MTSYLALIVFGLFLSLLMVGYSKLFSKGYETLINLVCAGLYLVCAIVDKNLIFVPLAILFAAFSFRKGKFTFSPITLAFVLVSGIVMFLQLDSYSIINVVRLLASAVFVGFVSQAMLLGHWYLVQPGLNRTPVKNLIHTSLYVLGFYIIVFTFFENGMGKYIFEGEEDGWGGLLWIMWLGNLVLSLGLLVASKYALKEKSYTAVMATTGLLYLAMISTFASDIIFRVI